MLHKIIGNKAIVTPFLRFETDSGVGLDPDFTTGGTATFEWISPDGSISTGAIPNPVLDQTGMYTVKCSDWSDITEVGIVNDHITKLENLSLLTSVTKIDVRVNAGLTELEVSGCPTLTRIYANNCNLSILDISNLTALLTMYCYDNSVSILDVALLTSLTNLRCQNNAMTEASVDKILADLVTAGANNGACVIDGTNAAPSAAGLASKAILVAAPRNWTVTTS